RAVWIDEQLTTLQAKNTLRIINGVPVPKPRVRVTWRQSGYLEGVLSVDVDELLPGETLADIRAVLQTIPADDAYLELDVGETDVEFPLPGTYYLTVTDDRVQQPMSPLEVKVE